GVFDGAVMAFEPGEKVKERIESDRGQEKRNSQAQRVTGKKQNPLTTGPLVASHNEDGRQDRSDARSPSGRKSQSHQKRTEYPNRLAVHVETFLIIQELNLEKAGNVQSKDDDQYPRDAIEENFILQKKSACISCGSAEQ